MRNWTARAMVLLFPALLLLLAGCAEKVCLRINDNILKAEVADTEKEREKGLMFRKSLPSDEGMLFILPEVKETALWMKNVPIPLSAAFVSEEGVITGIIDMKPMDETMLLSKEKVKYIIETNLGWFEKKGIRVGNKVEKTCSTK